MIRNVILHLHNEMPMKADVELLPTAADAGLLCTNLRTLEGKKPISTEFLDSVFLLPYNIIRFIEIPRDSIHEAGLDADLPPRHVELPASAGAGSAEANVIVTPPPTTDVWGNATEDEHADEPADEAIEHREPDEELLKRIREA